MRCPSCHREVAADARFCRHCGTSLTLADASGDGTPVSLDSGATVIDTGPPATGAGIGIGNVPELAPEQLFHDRYRVQEKLGQGGMGQVYRVEDQLTGDCVVLKLMRPELLNSDKAIARFRREGALTRSLHHTNIVALYDVNVVDGLTYVTMEYLEGQSLREFILDLRRRGEDLDAEVARSIIDPILDGLGAAHQAGVVHRDLKPENIMLKGDPRSGDFQLRIVDFGIARALASDSQLTMAGAALGTQAYMAPEQVTGADVVGPQADLYSAAVILYELLVQVIPSGHWELPSRIRPELPASLDAIIERGLNPHPRRRYQDAAEFRAALSGTDSVQTGTATGGERAAADHQPHRTDWAEKLTGGVADAQKSAHDLMWDLMGGKVPDTRDQTTDLPLASFGQRLKAGAIDFAIVFGGLLVIFGALSEEYVQNMNEFEETMLGFGFLLTWFLVALAYYGLNHYYSGQTPGKKKVGIKVVGPNGAKLNENQASLRAIGCWLSQLFLGWGFWGMRNDPNGQAWHDKWAGTYVVRTDARR